MGAAVGTRKVWLTRIAGTASLLVVLSLGPGCASSPQVVRPRSPWPAEDLEFLISPLSGYELLLDSESSSEIESAHQAMMLSGDSSAAEEVARRWLERNADLHPAKVLLAQVDYLGARYVDAMQQMKLVVWEMEGYTAAQLLLGRAAEQLGDLPAAYGAFYAVAPQSQIAAQRERELYPRTVEILTNRVADGLARGRLEDASRAAELLQMWATEEQVTLEAALDVARAMGDGLAELQAVRTLAGREPKEIELQREWADLELRVGDPGAGLRIYQSLAAEHPLDPDLVDRLAAAKFVWRLQMLPDDVRDLYNRAEMSRADFATLLYWLFPGVRHSRVSRGVIATDILDHDRRSEIVRVVNLGLLNVEPSLHRFNPDKAVARSSAFRSLLRLMSAGRPKPACLQSPLPRDLSAPTVCRSAHSCGLLETPETCFPSSSLSGEAAVEMARKALELVGSE